jgi:hypothetical protein
MKHHLHIVTYSAAWSYTHLVPGLDLGKPLTKTFLVGQVRRPWLIFIVRIDGKEPEVRGSTYNWRYSPLLSSSFPMSSSLEKPLTSSTRLDVSHSFSDFDTFDPTHIERESLMSQHSLEGGALKE